MCFKSSNAGAEQLNLSVCLSGFKETFQVWNFNNNLYYKICEYEFNLSNI